MIAPAVTAFHAGLLGLLLVWLSLRVIRLRRGAKVAIGSGGNRLLERAQRAQANFAEYVPMTLLLMGLSEMLGAWPPLLHGFGVALLAGRVLHGVGIAREPEDLRYRIAGMRITLNVLIAASLTASGLAVWQAIG